MLNRIDIVQDTNSIQFHASTLKLGLIKLTSDSLAEEMEQEVSSHAFDDQEERVTMKLPATLLAGSQARLKIDFSGDLAGNLMGYYRAKFEQNGEAAYYALTQFQVTQSCKVYTDPQLIVLTARPPLPGVLSLVGTNPP